MKHKFIYRASLTLNILFIVFFLFLGLRFREKITNYLFDKKNPKIVLFGDSNLKLGQWDRLLNRTDIKNAAVGGATTGDFVDWVHERVISYRPEICFIQGGINDIVKGIPNDCIAFNYKSLIDTLLENKITPVVQSVFYQENNPQSKVLVDSLNNFLIGYCSAHQVYYLDINSKLSDHSGLKAEYSRDGTHISEKAYDVWANEMNLLLAKIESGSNKR